MNRTKRSDSPSSGPLDGFQAFRPSGTSYRGHSNESRQESLHRPMRPIPRSSRADSRIGIAHEEARSASRSTERRLRASESPSATHSRSPQSSRVTHSPMRSPQVEDKRRFSGNVVRQHGRPSSASPLADSRQKDIGPQSSDGFSFYLQSPPVNAFLHLEPPRASGSQGPITQKRASVQSPDSYPDSFSFDCSEIQSRAPSPHTGIETGDSLGPPGSLRQSPARSHISLASSNETSSVFSFDVSISVVETPRSLGRSAHVASLPAPQPTVSPFVVSSPVENTTAGPSTQSQEGPNEEENEDSSQASSDDTRFETVCDAEDLLERTNSPQVDRSIAFNDSPSLSRPLSPLIVASTSRSLTHLTQSIRPSGHTTALSSPLVWPWWSPSLSPYVDSESSHSTEGTGLGLSIEGSMSPSLPSHSPQHRTTAPAPSGSLPHRLAGRIEGQSSTGPDPPPRGASVSQAPPSPSPSHLGSAVSDLTYQSEGARFTNSVAPSPRNVPLPSSPPTSTPRSSPARRLQAQPSHRSSPLMPFYPSLAIVNVPSTPPSRLNIDFDRPTPRLSPSHITVVPAPAASRTPSADPRSPLSRLARLPGSIMEISRFATRFFLFHLSSGLLITVCGVLQEPFLWSSHTSKGWLRCANNSVKFWRAKENGFTGGELD